MNIETKILRQLLNTEFKELKEKYGKIEIKWRRWRFHTHIEEQEDGMKVYYGVHLSWVAENAKTGKYLPIIFLNNGYIGSQSAFRNNKKLLFNTLRHECLHLLLERGDDDPKFIKEAKKRGLDLDSDSEFNLLVAYLPSL